jgi:hypothetical protein
MVEVARDLPRVAVADLPWGGAEPVPDAFAASIVVPRTLDLVRRCGGTPDEVVWEGAGIGGHVFLSVSSTGQ